MHTAPEGPRDTERLPPDVLCAAPRPNLRGESLEPRRRNSHDPRDAVRRLLAACSWQLENRRSHRASGPSMAHLPYQTFLHIHVSPQRLPKTPRQLLTFSFHEILQYALTNPRAPVALPTQHFDIGSEDSPRTR